MGEDGKSKFSCTTCPYYGSCISAHVLSGGERHDPFSEIVRSNKKKHKNKKSKTNNAAELPNGEESHRELELERGVLKDKATIIDKLKRRESICFSLTFCSRSIGLRGTPDAVFASFDNEKNELTLKIIEDKRSPHERDHYQLWTYGILLTSRDVLAMSTSESGKITNADKIPFYEQVLAPGMHYRVLISLNYYYYGIRDNNGVPLDNPMSPLPISKDGEYRNAKVRAEANEVIKQANKYSPNMQRELFKRPARKEASSSQELPARIA
ncbi:MAG: hypothetical protein ACP5MC_00470 [Candidatus Micrarchaeia archaeon]